MESQTCMEYLFDCVLSNRTENINQDILFNASNEFRNIWNLVKKLQDLARVDVQKITKFLDAVQEALGKKNWTGAARQCMQAENEYRQIRRYIRPSYLEDFKVSRFIETGTTEKKSAPKPDKKPVSSSANHVPKQNFRNHQINKQDIIKQHTENEGKPVKGSEQVNKDTGKNAREKSKTVNSKKPHDLKAEKHNTPNKQKEFMMDNNTVNSLSNKQDNLVNSKNQKSSDNNGKAAQNVSDKQLNDDVQLNKEQNENEKNKNVEVVDNCKEQDGFKQETGSAKITSNENGKVKSIENGKTEISPPDLIANKLNDGTSQNDLDPDALISEMKQSPNTLNDKKNDIENKQYEHSETKSDTKATNNKNKDTTQTDENMGDKSQKLDIASLISERLTELGQDSNVEIIADELTHIYEIDWKLAYKGLTECKPSNGMKNTIDFLSEILKEAVRRVTVHRAKERKTPKKIPSKWPVNSLLKSLKESFLTVTLKELQSKFSVMYAKDTDGEYSVNIYTAKCVELAWFMFSKNPPMVFDYNSRPMLLEDLFQIYKPYKSEGKCIQYVVWPAIRQCVGGEIVAQGVADYR